MRFPFLLDDQYRFFGDMEYLGSDASHVEPPLERPHTV